MTSTPVSNLARAQQGPPVLLSKTAKLWTAVIGMLMVAFHWHLISRMGQIAIKQPDWSHILIIPLISVYYIHLNRQQLMATERKLYPPGFAFICFGIVGYILGVYPLMNDMVQGYSMILTLFGIVLMLMGPGPMRVLWFPIAFLVFAIKISGGIWAVIASKMQAIAAFGAYITLKMTHPISDIDAELRGSTIDLFIRGATEPTALNVAEACAGMRMLMAFLALGAALAFIFPRTWWQRLIMVALAAPIAIFVNVMRVAVLGWVHLIDPELAKNDSHLLIGMFMLIPAAGLLMLVGWCLDKIVIKEGKADAPAPPIPFDSDPQQVTWERKPFFIGTAIAAGIVILFTGLSYVIFFGINQIEFAAIGKLPPYGVQLGLFLICLIVTSAAAGLGWVKFMAKHGPKLEKAARFSFTVGIACGMLTVGLIVKASVIQATGMVLTKDAVPLRHQLAFEFPDQAGDWQLLHDDPKLPKSIEDELGTKKYFNRWYIDNAAGFNTENVKASTVETDMGEQLNGWSGINTPGGLAKVHIAYYTGMLDTAPHVPDKCWLVAGQELVYRGQHTLKLARSDYAPDPDHEGLVLAKSHGFNEIVRLPSDEIEAIIFTGMNDAGQKTTALYFFLANGKAVASNKNVRFNFSLEDKYTYYCKVEVMFPGVNDPDMVVKHAEDLLSDLMPEVMACLPDWTEVQAGQYPTPADNTDK